MLTPWKESYDQPRQHIQKQRHYFANKGLSSQGYGFSSGHVWMWELDCEESWASKNWCFWTVVLEKTLESPLDCKEVQPVHPKDQSWVFIGRTDAEDETPILWPPDVKKEPVRLVHENVSWIFWWLQLDVRHDWVHTHTQLNDLYPPRSYIFPFVYALLKLPLKTCVLSFVAVCFLRDHALAPLSLLSDFLQCNTHSELLP